MSFELEHQVFSLFLGIWAAFMLQDNFNIQFGILIVVYISVILFFLRRGFMSKTQLRVRLGLHTMTVVVTILAIPSLLWGIQKLLAGYPIDESKVAFLGIIVLAWIAGVELSRHDQEAIREEWFVQ